MEAATWITAIASVVMALTSAAMAWVAWESHRLHEQAKAESAQRQKDFDDLLEALVIATLISGPSSYGGFNDAIRAFRERYKGQRQIFKGPLP